ncbi:serine/threonine protein kinase, partial [Streptomyces sp. SID8111]|nr:serine/threonine protein kinase [Streptomyces sp. SID8111]NEC80312.1 serine/threonine protein kinase [Streptomyces sp. SID7958]
RLTLAAAAVALAAALGVGAWLATADDDTGTPQDTRNSAPTTP